MLPDAFAQTIYVQEGASGGGTSWTDATGDLKLALDNATAGSQIWVARGTYKPTTCTVCTVDDQRTYLQLKTGVSLYGGFNGSENLISQRNIAANPTILSGDIDGDNTLDGNSYTILYSENATDCRIDGLIFEAGNAQDFTAFGEKGNSGAAWYNTSILSGNFSNPIAANCTFRNNNARAFGGAVYQGGAFSGSVAPTFENCRFENNTAQSFGGGLYYDISFGGTGTLTMRDCAFTSNQSQTSGGAITLYNTENGNLTLDIEGLEMDQNSSVNRGGALYIFGKNGELSGTLKESTFADNDGGLGGGLYFNVSNNGTSNVLISDCTFTANDSQHGGGAIYLDASEGGSDTTRIDQCHFEQNYCDGSGGTIFINGVQGWAKTEVSSCVFWRNTCVFYGGAFYNFGKSGLCQPLIHNCLFYENQGSSAGAIYNLGSDNGDASPDILNCTFYGNKASVGACVYNQANDFTGTCSTNVVNCVFWGNHAGFGPIFQNGHSFPTISYCLFDVDDCEALNTGLNGMTTCGPGLIYQQDPMFADSSNQNFRLTDASPVLNIGSDTLINTFGIAKDLDALDRIEHGTVDYGAYEYRGLLGYVPPSITSSARDTLLCSGANLSLAVTAVGTPPLSYQWFLGGNPISGATSSQLILNPVEVGDAGIYTCQVSSTQGDQALSDPASVEVMPTVLPEAILTASDTQICVGEEVLFTAQFSHAGASPIVNWYLNDALIQAGGTNYSTTNFQDGDEVYVQLASSENCVSANPVNSNLILIQVESPVTVSVGITTATTICDGEPFTFDAIASNGGNNPTYEWLLNGQVVAGGASYTSTTFQDGDQVQCRLTSSQACVVASTVVSDIQTLSVILNSTPAVQLSSSATSICAGEEILFTASPTNEGTMPQYQWFLNGRAFSNSGASYTTASLEDGDEVSVELSSSLTCVTPSSVQSNTIGISVIENQTPSVQVTSSDTQICVGEVLEFIAQYSNGGSNPTFVWTLNGQDAGIDQDTLQLNNLPAGTYEVQCQMTSVATCVLPAIVQSEILLVEVTPLVEINVDLSVNSAEICEGDMVTFSVAHDGSAPAQEYEWIVDGETKQMGPSDEYMTSDLSDGSAVQVALYFTLDCLAEHPFLSNVIEIDVTSTAQPEIQISTSSLLICPGDTLEIQSQYQFGGTNPNFEWYLNGDLIITGPEGITTDQINPGDTLSCTFYTSLDCTVNDIATSNALVFGEATNCTVNTAELALDNVSIFPNPTTGLLHLQFDVQDRTQLSLLNSLGQEIQSTVHQPGNHQLQWSLDCPAGVYFLRWSQPKGSLVRRIVVLE